MENEIKNLKILIVDDQVSNIDILQELLKIEGYENIFSISDSRKAISLIQKLKPDLLLLDLMMPYVSGFDILKELDLLESNKYENIRVLVITADVNIYTRQKALALGAHDFITKIFDFVEVGLRIKNLLSNAYLFKQLQNQNEILEEKVKIRTQELLKSNLAIKEQNSALKDIAWMQSHVVRAPVARIMGLINTIAEDDCTDREKESLINEISISAKELDKVVKEITKKTYTNKKLD